MKTLVRFITMLLVLVVALLAALLFAVANGVAEINDELCGHNENTLCIPTK